MKSDASFVHRFRIDFILLSIIIILVCVVLLNRYPIKISKEDTAVGAVMPQQMGASSVLLILPDTTVTAESFAEMDFSLAWYNVLTQMVGPFRIALAKDIKTLSDLDAQLIVIPQRTGDLFTEAQIQLISQVVSDGASLIIEMPKATWSPLTALKHHARSESALKRLSDAPNSPLTNVYRDQLMQIPLDTQMMRVDSLDAETLPQDNLLLELDGGAAHYRRAFGAGYVYVLTFHFGQAITALQQGRPSDDFKIKTQEDIKVSDLVLNEKMRTNGVPFADLLKRHVIASVMQTTPMPILFPFPDAYRSALLISHETGTLDEKAFLASEPESAMSARTTWFVTPGKIVSSSLKQHAESGFEVGASLVRPPMGKLYQAKGPSFFKPIAVESTMGKQVSLISTQVGGVTTCRIAGDAWTPDYSQQMRFLSGARCGVDTTYGPSRSGEWGYLFGSAYPFLALERNGLPLPTYEFPRVMDDRVGLDTLPAQTALQMLKDAENVWHEPVMIHFNADTMLERPSYLSPQTHQMVLKYAGENRIWMPTVREFMTHYTTRKQARMRYVFHRQTHQLDISLHLPPSEHAFTLAFPKKTVNGSVHTIRVNTQLTESETLKTTADNLLILLPLLPGEHSLQIQYQ